MRVAVAGGGIAGLTAAIALAARGFPVALFERARAASRRSAPASSSRRTRWRCSSGSASRATFEGRLFEPEALVIRSARKRRGRSRRLPLGKAARERYGAPYCTLHRADLQAALLATARRTRRSSSILAPRSRRAAGGEERRLHRRRAGRKVRRADRRRRRPFARPHRLFRPSRAEAARPHRLARDRCRRPSVAGLAPLDVTGLWLGARRASRALSGAKRRRAERRRDRRNEGRRRRRARFGRAARAR